MKKQLQKAFALWMAAILLLTAGCSKSRKNVSTSDVSPTETEAVSTDDDETMDYDTFSDIMNEIKARDYSNPGSSPYLMQDVYRLTYCELFSEKDMNEYAKKYTKSLKKSSAKKFARNLNMIYESASEMEQFELSDDFGVDNSSDFAEYWGVSDQYGQPYVRGGFHYPEKELTQTFESWLEKFNEDELSYSSAKVELSKDNTADTVAIDMALSGVAFGNDEKACFRYEGNNTVIDFKGEVDLMMAVAANADVPDEQLEEAVRLAYLQMYPSDRVLLDYQMKWKREGVDFFRKNPDVLVDVLNNGWYDDEYDFSHFSMKKYDVFVAALSDVSHVSY